MKVLIINKQTSTDYEIRQEVYDGKNYIIVPVVMMVQGVHDGSRGPVLHLSEELEACIPAWNGIPVMIKHPSNEDGMFISANSPDIRINSVGTVFNAHIDGDKLKAEVWFDETKLIAISPTAHQMVLDRLPLDVSVGIFSREEESSGSFNNENYIAIAHDYRPDHLAILPGERGACSWSDGCGIRVNSNGLTKNKQSNEMETDVIQIYKDLNKKGMAIVPIENSINIQLVLQKIWDYVNSMDNDMRSYFVEEIYDDFFVYRVRYRNSDQQARLYKQSFTVEGEKDAIEVSLVGDAEEVRKNVSYDALQMKRTKFNNNSNQMDTKKFIDDLIANTNSKFTECDRQWLSGLSAENLAKMEPTVVTKEVPAATPPAGMQVNEAMELVKKNLAKPEDVIALLGEGLKKTFTQGLELYKAQKTSLIESITANSDQFTKEELEGMDDAMLTKISNSLKPKDFSALGAGSGFKGAGNGAGDGELEVLPPTGVSFEKK